MSTNIIANLSKLYDLGHRSGQVEWSNALRLAARHADWLESDLTEAVRGMREWWSACGSEDASSLTTESALAIFVQEIGHELRLLELHTTDAEDESLAGYAACYERVDWSEQGEYPCGAFYVATSGALMVEFYTGP